MKRLTFRAWCRENQDDPKFGTMIRALLDDESFPWRASPKRMTGYIAEVGKSKDVSRAFGEVMAKWYCCTSIKVPMIGGPADGYVELFDPRIDVPARIRVGVDGLKEMGIEPASTATHVYVYDGLRYRYAGAAKEPVPKEE